MGDPNNSSIILAVVDETGNKANCKLFRNDKLSEILSKYNKHLKTNFDSIHINDKAVDLSKSPAQLGLADGNVLKLVKFIPTTATATATTGIDPAQQQQRKIVQLEETLRLSHEALRISQARVAELEGTVSRLQSKLSEEEQKMVCSICLERERDSLIFPCLHFAYCNACLVNNTVKITTCPSCRAYIAGILKIRVGM